MERKDRITLIVFIVLIVAIIVVYSLDLYRNRKLENVDRKVEYILGYTSDDILNKGETLFLQTVDLFQNKNVFEYVLDLDGKVRHYSINRVNDYMKITNFSIATNNFSRKTLEEYMDYKKIIHFENSYYMEDEKIEKNNYVGSMLEINSYGDEEVIFKSINYYCDGLEYKGILYEIPNCDYKTDENNFKMILENNIFKVNDIDIFININK